MSVEIIVVLVNCATREEAGIIARSLLDSQLAACVSIGAPVESHYHWEGSREQAVEHPLWIKTTRERWPELEAEVRRLHSYTVPEILALPIAAGSAAYLRWVAEATTS